MNHSCRFDKFFSWNDTGWLFQLDIQIIPMVAQFECRLPPPWSSYWSDFSKDSVPVNIFLFRLDSRGTSSGIGQPETHKLWASRSSFKNSGYYIPNVTSVGLWFEMCSFKKRVTPRYFVPLLHSSVNSDGERSLQALLDITTQNCWSN